MKEVEVNERVIQHKTLTEETAVCVQCEAKSLTRL